MIVSVAPVSAPVAAKLAAVAAPDAVSVPVDTSPTVVKFPALAVLLLVSVLPVIPVAELSRPRWPRRERCAGDCARGVHVVAQQLVAAHVALRGEPVQRGRAREGQQVRQQVRYRDRLSLEGAGPNLCCTGPACPPTAAPARGWTRREGSEVQLRDSLRGSAGKCR